MSQYTTGEIAKLAGVTVRTVQYYDHNISFICPECHKIFKPSRWESLWAKHTTTTRKLHCSGCGYYGYCVETYQVEER